MVLHLDGTVHCSVRQTRIQKSDRQRVGESRGWQENVQIPQELPRSPDCHRQALCGCPAIVPHQLASRPCPGAVLLRGRRWRYCKRCALEVVQHTAVLRAVQAAPRARNWQGFQARQCQGRCIDQCDGQVDPVHHPDAEQEREARNGGLLPLQGGPQLAQLHRANHKLVCEAQPVPHEGPRQHPGGLRSFTVLPLRVSVPIHSPDGPTRAVLCGICVSATAPAAPTVRRCFRRPGRCRSQ
mmetsp:Transcript_25713/g.37933  ORF Transcript_25713/g.37933 Transcript_25713/m.37933 type:complete len:240 (+) Transcript_25713:1810-2529(+)